MSRRARIILPTAVGVWLATVVSVSAQAGLIDAGFGGSGSAIIDSGSASVDTNERVLVQPDGKILVTYASVASGADFVVRRFNANGTADTAFATAGVATTNIGGDDAGMCVALQSDGKAIVGGAMFTSNSSRVVLVRYQSSGALDSSFGSGGQVKTNLGNGNAPSFFARCTILIQPDGKIVLATTVERSGGSDFAVLRYSTSGSLDTTFNSSGIVYTDFGGYDYANTALLQSDGKIVVAGSAASAGGDDEFALARYTTAGALDATFGASGKSVTSFGTSYDWAQVLLPLAGGKLLAIGNADNAAVFARYQANGALDTTFGTNGQMLASPDVFFVNDAVLQADDRFVVAGSGFGGAPFTLARYLSNGLPDVTFGAGGRARPPATDSLEARGAALQSDGRVVVSGVNYGTTAAVVTRYLGGPVGGGSVADFDGDGRADPSVFRRSTGQWLQKRTTAGSRTTNWGGASDLVVPGDYDGDGKSDAAIYRPADGYFWILLSSTNFTTYRGIGWGTATDVAVPADYDGDGKTDVAIYRPSDGYWWMLFSASNYTTYRGIGWGSATDVPVPGDYDGDGKADLAVYRPSDGRWWILYSTSNYTTWRGTGWGSSTDIPVPGDYDGDGKLDMAIFRPSDGYWWILFSASNYTTWRGIGWGSSTDVPVPGDFDGDGKTDVAIYRPSDGYWWVLQSSANFTTWQGIQWGVSTDQPAAR